VFFSNRFSGVSARSSVVGALAAASAVVAAVALCATAANAQPTPAPAASPSANSASSDAAKALLAPVAAPNGTNLVNPAPASVSAATAMKPGQSTVRQGDTAWILTSAALVLFMVFPGLCLFYGGLVRRKNVISIYAQCLVISAATILSWVAISYSLAFSPTGGAYIGDLSRAGLTGIANDSMFVGGEALEWPMVVFHLTFAIITAALVIGSFAERVRPGGVLLFGLLWPALVYAPIARWVWHSDGWLAKMGHIDWAGGTVVHVAAGFAGLAAAMVTGRRLGYGEEAMTPNHMGLTLAGAGCLLVGWMGFNGGSALHADSAAAIAIVNTLVAGAAGAVVWIIIEGALRGYASGLGMASGVLGGLIAVTPAAGFVTPLMALAYGALGAAAGYFGAVVLKRMLNVDDSLDVFGLHGVAGVVGSITVGLLASSQVKSNIGVQSLATGVVAMYAFFATLALVAALRALGTWRVAVDEELEGLDVSQHAESV
jgi:ammonium transporter, Amt family